MDDELLSSAEEKLLMQLPDLSDSVDLKYEIDKTVKYINSQKIKSEIAQLRIKLELAEKANDEKQIDEITQTLNALFKELK